MLVLSTTDGWNLFYNDFFWWGLQWGTRSPEWQTKCEDLHWSERTRYIFCLAFPALKYVSDCTAVPLTLEKHLQQEQSQQPVQGINLDTQIHCDLVFEIASSLAFLWFFFLTFPGLILIFAEQTFWRKRTLRIVFSFHSLDFVYFQFPESELKWVRCGIISITYFCSGHSLRGDDTWCLQRARMYIQKWVTVT